MVSEEKYDALVGRHCRTCAMWHNPEGQTIGYCVAEPPTPFIVGMQPAIDPRLHIDPKKPLPMMAKVDAKVPVCGGDDGCWKHVARKTIKPQ